MAYCADLLGSILSIILKRRRIVAGDNEANSEIVVFNGHFDHRRSAAKIVCTSGGHFPKRSGSRKTMRLDSFENSRECSNVECSVRLRVRLLGGGKKNSRFCMDMLSFTDVHSFSLFAFN